LCIARHTTVTHAREQCVDSLLHGTANVGRAHLDVPAEIVQFQHRHHAVDGHDRDAVDLRVGGGRQFRIGCQTVDVGQIEPPLP
jgi:hypothetical protein